MDARITPGTRRRVDHLFARKNRGAAVHLLVEGCHGSERPDGAREDARALERIRFAALKVSGGSLERLRAAVALARTDWRDLLVAADFAEDVHAHERWPAPVAED